MVVTQDMEQNPSIFISKLITRKSIRINRPYVDTRSHFRCLQALALSQRVRYIWFIYESNDSLPECTDAKYVEKLLTNG